MPYPRPSKAQRLVTRNLLFENRLPPIRWINVIPGRAQPRSLRRTTN